MSAAERRAAWTDERQRGGKAAHVARERSESAGSVSAGWDGHATRWSALHGGYDLAGAPGVVRGWLRASYRLARILAALRVSPTAVTATGVVLAAGVPAAVVLGGAGPLVAAGLVLLGALADSADGSLALLTDRETRLGRVYDSVADRLTEAAWLAGLWMIGAPGWLVTLGGAVAWLHEYVRARATTAGMEGVGTVTLGERPTRVLLVIFGLVSAGLTGFASADLAAGTATVAVAVWVLIGTLGLAQLAAAVRRTLGQ